ncbi:molybdopterin biosynthesis protein [Salinibaculum salinum]|uniref:molybdopterin biosynthesis protein n=1 Tax=Salinibaculum salinum TaxID=3131996 RepID=UPI0030EEC546
MTRREFRDLVPPATARDALADLAITAGTDTVPLAEANGRTLAAHVDAPLDVPGFDRSAMDGYAVRAADTFGASEGDPTTLRVVGTVRAGTEPDASVGEGDAVQVATGAVLPSGADAVVPVERTVEREDTVDVMTGVAPGDSVMPRGADIAAGDAALGPGTTLGPRHLGLLAALGHERVPVRSQPDVAVVSTGEELVQPGEEPDPAAGQIYDVNSHTIAAAVDATGARATRYTPATDDEETLRETLADAAADASLIVTSGSTSAGAADLLYRLVEEHGEILVHGVAIKPGRPLLVGRIFDTPYVGLPGYPVSALSVFRTFVAPRLRAVSGRPQPETATADATLATRVRYDGGRRRLVAVGLVADGDGDLVAYAPAKGSGATTTLAETDGIVQMAAETSLLAAGETVTVERFDDAPIPALLGVGDPDPVFARLLDDFATSRFLSLSATDASRWVDDDVPDVTVTPTDDLTGTRAEPLARWNREWGLVVPAGNPDDITALSDLVDGDYRFANLDDSLAVRTALAEHLETLALDSAEDTAAAIDGFHRELPGIESAARSVAAGRADAGLGLRVTATQLGLEFVPVGTQTLGVVPNPTRLDKSSVERLRDHLADRLPSLLTETPGYAPAE